MTNSTGRTELTMADQLEALPDRSVIRDHKGWVLEKVDGSSWNLTGSDAPVGHERFTFPVLVLWEGGADE